MCDIKQNVKISLSSSLHILIWEPHKDMTVKALPNQPHCDYVFWGFYNCFLEETRKWARFQYVNVMVYMCCAATLLSSYISLSCKHKQNSHKHTSVWKGYPVQQLLLCANTSRYRRVLQNYNPCRETAGLSGGKSRRGQCVYWGNYSSQSSVLARPLNTWGEARNVMLPSGPGILDFFWIYLLCFIYIVLCAVFKWVLQCSNFYEIRSCM